VIGRLKTNKTAKINEKIITILFLLISLFTFGTLDTSFNPSSLVLKMAQMVAFMPHLLTSMVKSTLGRFFYSYDGISKSRVAKLSEEGILDLFNSGTGAQYH
jgi:hypothetical protein